jgi:hypothetical protein
MFHAGSLLVLPTLLIVCLLHKSLYGLCQAPRAWFDRFAKFMITIGFTLTRSDSLLCVFHHGNDITYLLFVCG